MIIKLTHWFKKNKRLRESKKGFMYAYEEIDQGRLAQLERNLEAARDFNDWTAFDEGCEMAINLRRVCPCCGENKVSDQTKTVCEQCYIIGNMDGG